jgi:hypothetical protein
MTIMSTPTVDAALERLIDTYCSAWNEPDASCRESILSPVWVPGATYTDPTVCAAGIDELLAHIAKVIARRPGAKVVRTSAIDAHHGLARFAWRIVRADGSMLPQGIDFAEISAAGRIQRIIGFFGPLASL